MRTFDEIQVDINQAFSIKDADALYNLAVELRTHCTKITDAEASKILGHSARIIGDYPIALEHFRQALEVYEEQDDRLGAARVTADIGAMYLDTGDYPLALDQFRKALAIFELLDKRTAAAFVINNMGNVFRNISDYPLALDHYGRALALYEEIGNRSGVALVAGNMGSVFINISDHTLALEHYHRAIAIHEEQGRGIFLANVTGDLGSVYVSTGDYSQALEHFRRALDIHKELGDSAGAARDTGNIATMLMNLDRFIEAKELLDLQAGMPMVNPSVKAQHKANCARLAEHQEDLNAAHRYLTDALAIAIEAGLRAESALYHKALRDLAQKRNDFAGYIEHNNEYQRITEEVNGKATAQKLAMMEAEKHIAAERAETEKHRALLYNTLPPSIADRVLRGEQVNDSFVNAAVMFMDMVGFTTMSATMDPNDVVRMLSEVFTACDTIMNEHGLMKIKTIGDSYMAVAFPSESTSSEQRVASVEERAARAATAILLMMSDRFPQIRVRIGVHCGPVTAGVIGTERLQYDVWGDTVNVASRMESTGEPGRIHVSEAFATSLGLRPRNDSTPLPHDVRNDSSSAVDGEGRDVIPSVSEEPGTWHLALRGETELKGKGPMTTYWLESTQPVAWFKVIGTHHSNT